jgi:predicted nucleic acid-binding protein
MVIWWATPVEVRTALARIARQQALSQQRREMVLARFALLEKSWNEVLPSDRVRDLALGLPDRFDLRTGDAFQLAAALAWCNERPRKRPFVCFDRRLTSAAAEAGFTLVHEL